MIRIYNVQYDFRNMYDSLHVLHVEPSSPPSSNTHFSHPKAGGAEIRSKKTKHRKKKMKNGAFFTI